MPFSSHSMSWGCRSLRISSRIAGCNSLNRCTASGRNELATVGNVPSANRPWRSPAISARSASAADSRRSTMRACAASTRPASVGDIPRACRRNSG